MKHYHSLKLENFLMSHNELPLNTRKVLNKVRLIVTTTYYTENKNNELTFTSRHFHRDLSIINCHIWKLNMTINRISVTKRSHVWKVMTQCTCLCYPIRTQVFPYPWCSSMTQVFVMWLNHFRGFRGQSGVTHLWGSTPGQIWK